MIKFRPVKPDEKIAVAIPTKNRPSYLAVLLTSLLSQTYTNWMILINDQSEIPVESDDTLKDVFKLIKKKGHDLKIIHTENGWERHQSAMEAVPDSIDFILRIDDDMLPEPDFLRNILKPFYYFPDIPLSATGGLYPEPKMNPVDLDVNLADSSWIPMFHEPTWKLQGHYYYNAPEILEVESLNGCAICYRRRAVEDAGGWAVEGYSDHASKEENDLSARLVEKNYTLMVTTEALAWHLLAPKGGAREFVKTDQGNFIVSGMSGIESDDRLFYARMKGILQKRVSAVGELRRYKISDLEKNEYRSFPLVTLKGKILKSIERKFLRKLKRLYFYFQR